MMFSVQPHTHSSAKISITVLTRRSILSLSSRPSPGRMFSGGYPGTAYLDLVTCAPFWCNVVAAEDRSATTRIGT